MRIINKVNITYKSCETPMKTSFHTNGAMTIRRYGRDVRVPRDGGSGRQEKRRLLRSRKKFLYKF